MSAKITIINYGMGNLNSVNKKLTQLNANVIITSSIDEIKKCDKIILPGVGHFGTAMQNLQKLNLIDVLNEEILVRKKPIIGICLGMQLMAKFSEEGNVNGLGWLSGNVVKFQVKDNLNYKVPHTGWNQISLSKKSSLMKGINDEAEFYFIHSYHYKTNDNAEILNITNYEYDFISGVEKENIYGVQYHPEKSQDVGELLLKNFLQI